jgi:hypothetical protein
MMKLKLEARRMWNIMRLGGASRHEDRRALEVLLSAILPEMLSGKPTARTPGMPLPLPRSVVIVSASPRYRSFNRNGITWLSSMVRTSTTLLSTSPA